MAFISNREKSGVIKGGFLRLTRDVEVLSGTFKRNSRVIVMEEPARDDYRGEFKVVDIDSGEELYLSTVLGGYVKD